MSCLGLPRLDYARLTLGLLLCFLVVPEAPVAAGEASTAAAYCVASIRGSGSAAGPLDSFSWSCTSNSSRPTVGVDKSLASLSSNAEGITFSDTCTQPGCLITICGSTPLVLWHSSFTGVNVDGLDSVLCAVDSSRVIISNSTFSSNRARAIQARDSANVTITDSKIVGNGLPRGNGGGVWLGDGSPSLTMLNSTVSSNKASSGGGLWLGDSATAVINSSSISGNQCAALRGAPSGLGGGFAVTDNATVALGGGSRIDSNSADTSGAGMYSAGTAALIVSPDVKFGLNQVHNKSFGYDIAASGASRLELPPATFATDMFAALTGISKCSKGVALERTPCGVGEFKDNRTGVCMCCPERTYSLDTSGSCLACPENGSCPGGDALQPLPGYWRSSNQSTQMHLCPLGKRSCAGDGQCKKGYTGRLCASCDQGYGMVGPLRCGKCLNPRLQFAIYIIFGIVTVFFVAITVHLTYADNVQGCTDLRPSDFITCLVRYLQYHSIIGCVNLPWPKWYEDMFRATDSVYGVGAWSAASLQCWVVPITGKPKDRLPAAVRSQLVFFMTPFLVFAAAVLLRLLWWVVMYCVSAAASKSSSKRVTPGCVTAVTPLPLCVLARKLPLTALVVVFFAYPTLLRTALRFFACLPIDSAIPGSLGKLLSHKQGYLTMDLNQECWVGWHRAWALGLGVPSVLITCVMMPVGLFWLLRANAARADELCFRETFGFLYRNYKPKWIWFEAVWAVETVMLSVLAATHFSIGAYQSVLLMSFVFFVSACVQGICKPYTHRKLHHVQYGSTAVLFLTTLAALSMFAVDKPEASMGRTRMVIAAFTMIMDVGFVLWCLYAAARSSGKSIRAVLNKLLGCIFCTPTQQFDAGHVGRPQEVIKEGTRVSEPPSWPNGSPSNIVVVASAQQLGREHN